MKRFSFLFGAMLLLALFAFVPSVAAAPSVSPSLQEAGADFPTLPDLFDTGKTLLGVSLFFAALINLGKIVKPEFFPDDSAQKWTLATQSVTLIVLVGLQLSGKANLIPVIDENAGLIANLLNAFIALGFQLLMARKAHDSVLAGYPGIGKSYSGRQAGTQQTIEYLGLSEDAK